MVIGLPAAACPVVTLCARRNPYRRFGLIAGMEPRAIIEALSRLAFAGASLVLMAMSMPSAGRITLRPPLQSTR